MERTLLNKSNDEKKEYVMQQLTNISKNQELQREIYEKAKAKPKYGFTFCMIKISFEHIRRSLKQDKSRWWNRRSKRKDG